MAARATITATYEAAFSRKHAARPTVAINNPAMAGPTTRVAVNTALFRLTPLATSSGPTISITKLCLAGLSNSVTMPRANAKASTIHSLTAFVRTSTPSTSASVPDAPWVPIRILRLSNRSASKPPHGPASSTGRNCSPAVRPRASPLRVSFSTSQI